MKGEMENKMKPNWRNVMTNLYAVAAVAAVLLGGTLNAAAAGPAPTGIKNVVLVHGAFADGSGWEAVAKILEKDGYRVSVAQRPPTDLVRRRPKIHERPLDARAGRSSSSATATAGPSSAGPATTQTLRHSSTSLHLHSMKVTAARRSGKPCRKRPRHSSRIATGTGG